MSFHMRMPTRAKSEFSAHQGQLSRTKGFIGKIVVAHAYFVGSFEKSGWEDNTTSAYWGFLLSVGFPSLHPIPFLSISLAVRTPISGLLSYSSKTKNRIFAWLLGHIRFGCW